jgi:NAD(P)H-dependent flavin oxidoreductase YrpB (nitropropane dioxygenase family)
MSRVARLSLQHPIVQAGMGGGIAGAELAGAVSAAGALGTVGIMAPGPFALALGTAQARAGAGRPVAANLLLPFTRRAHVEACIRARVPVVVLHAGRSPRVVRALREADIEVLHTVGTAAQAREALADGVSGLVAQGADAGGHIVGVKGTEATLAEVLEVADGMPVWAAGGVADAADVRRLIGLGADAAVAGTRFVLTTECGVHPAYKQALVAGAETVDTRLFGFGWPMRHRVLVNAAVRRWGDGPAGVRAVNGRSGRLGGLLPMGLMAVYPHLQAVRVPIFTPGPALAGMPARTVAVTPLYAGESVARLRDVLPAAAAVAALAG